MKARPPFILNTTTLEHAYTKFSSGKKYTSSNAHKDNL